MFHILWHFDEDVVVEQLVLVASEELLVEWKGSALLAFNLEVSHLLASVIELLGVLDADHGRAEWSGKVSLDLRLGVKDNAGFLLEDVGNLVAGDVVLGEVIKIDKLLWIHSKFFCFLFLNVGLVCFFFI